MRVPESYRVRLEFINAGKGDPGPAGGKSKGKGKGKDDGKDKDKNKDHGKSKDTPKGKGKGKGGAKVYAAWDGHQQGEDIPEYLSPYNEISLAQ